ncbi:uncharacterized protein NEMAJ01_2095 [Nematocida major]|uniref:uncharacterized protein n=1 Tax=Nematocida major TaxID=1912982 RepID=UPI0020083081|nr:uncharacterized protein NEMAJ01_2095 [Nematocida major]KAH9387199.1 hypothetical protein NEMAJ01_2095 [Nematocida major]
MKIQNSKESTPVFLLKCGLFFMLQIACIRGMERNEELKEFAQTHSLRIKSPEGASTRTFLPPRESSERADYSPEYAPENPLHYLRCETDHYIDLSPLDFPKGKQEFYMLSPVPRVQTYMNREYYRIDFSKIKTDDTSSSQKFFECMHSLLDCAYVKLPLYFACITNLPGSLQKEDIPAVFTYCENLHKKERVYVRPSICCVLVNPESPYPLFVRSLCRFLVLNYNNVQILVQPCKKCANVNAYTCTCFDVFYVLDFWLWKMQAHSGFFSRQQGWFLPYRVGILLDCPGVLYLREKVHLQTLRELLTIEKTYVSVRLVVNTLKIHYTLLREFMFFMEAYTQNVCKTSLSVEVQNIQVIFPGRPEGLTAEELSKHVSQEVSALESLTLVSDTLLSLRCMEFNTYKSIKLCFRNVKDILPTHVLPVLNLTNLTISTHDPKSTPEISFVLFSFPFPYTPKGGKYDPDALKAMHSLQQGILSAKSPDAKKLREKRHFPCSPHLYHSKDVISLFLFTFLQTMKGQDAETAKRRNAVFETNPTHFLKNNSATLLASFIIQSETPTTTPTETYAVLYNFKSKQLEFFTKAISCNESGIWRSCLGEMRPIVRMVVYVDCPYMRE